MVIHYDTRSVFKNIDAYMKLKELSVGDPDLHLEAKLSKVQLERHHVFKCLLV